MKKSSLILIGGGGHCKSCIDVIEQEGRYNILGILDVPAKKGENILGYEIIGNDNDYEKYHQQGCTFLITIGQIKTAEIRKRIFETLRELDAKIATIIAPTAYVSKYAEIGIGTIVMHHAFVNVGAKVGDNCILNTGCNIEHDAEIGQHSHISTGAFVNGNCKIGNEVFIGSSSCLVNGTQLTNNIVIGAGTVISRNLKESGVYIGNPTQKIK